MLGLHAYLVAIPRADGDRSGEVVNLEAGAALDRNRLVGLGEQQYQRN